MKRRDFIMLLGGASIGLPLPLNAQQRRRMPRIGIIDNGQIWDNFRQGLRDAGYIEGQNIAIEYLTAEGRPDRIAVAVAELVRLPVDVIAVFGTPASLAAKAATKSIPIVAISVGDPVRAGLVASLARPGGNVTGNSILGPDIIGKRLQLLKEIIPNLARVVLLWNPDNASNAAIFDEFKVAAPKLNIKALSIEARSVTDFEIAFAATIKDRPDAFMMTNDPFHQLHIVQFINFMATNRMPASYQTRDNVLAGGLMSYGASLPDLFRRGAGYVHKILQGIKPADLPVEQPTKFELVFNLKTAKALGLTISPMLLARADEVIE